VIEEQIIEFWKQQPSNVYGLSYEPTTEPEYSNDDPRIFYMVGNAVCLPMYNDVGKAVGLVHPGTSVRKSHLDLVASAISKTTTSILEIGVNRYGKSLFSTTTTILKNKASDCVYLGVDIQDKSYLNNPEKNIHTMLTNSKNRSQIRDKLLELGVEKIDFLMIDGDHSINYTVNDWCFTEFLSKSGVVVMHDTNVHIGPRAVFEAIDSKLFDKKRIGSEMVNGKFVDYGMCIARRLS